MTIQERLLKKVIKSKSGCWLWQGARSDKGRKGYGKIGIGKKIFATHRISYFIFRGPIPDNLCVLHVCDVRNCINPDHLFLGTYKDNAIDRAKKGRSWNCPGMKNPNARLTDTIVKKIRKERSILNTRELAEKYNITDTMVSHIVNRKSWKHI